MGFSIYYHSTRSVSPEERAGVRSAADRANKGRTWLSCEPVHFFEGESSDSGRLFGGSKMNFLPHPDDIKAAASEGYPDGDARDLFDVLCLLSREYGIDWEIGHDHVPGPVGYIRDGVCDAGLIDRAQALVDLTDIIDEYERGDTSGEEGEDEGTDNSTSVG